MEIADGDAHALLSYVEALGRQGYTISSAELEDYAAGRERRSFNLGGLSSLVQGYHVTLSAFGGSRQSEKAAVWLSRLRWVGVDANTGIHMTDLGRAVLRELEQRELEQELPVDVTLSPEDPVAYARVIERIAKHGKAMLVDSYFRLDDLLPLVNYTSVTRVLTGTSDRARLAGLTAGLSRLKIERPFEIRASNDVHDRFIIPAAGDVDSIGTSLTGVGKRLSILVRLREQTAALVRQQHEEAWAAAEPLIGDPVEESPATNGQAESVSQGPEAAE